MFLNIRIGGFLLLAAIMCACQSGHEVTVAVAANLNAPLEAVSEAFQQKSGWKPVLVSASSGVLTAQIMNQAPFDLFISANSKYPLRIHSEGLAVDSPHVLILGRLIFWSREPVGEEGLLNFITKPSVQSIALPHPDLAPYGRLAMDWLQQNGLAEMLQSKLVFGENVGHTNSILRSGAVDVGFTANSAREARELKDYGYWQLIDSSLTIPQTMVLLQDSPKARAFQAFLFSSEAQAIFAQYGYLAP